MASDLLANYWNNRAKSFSVEHTILTRNIV